MSAFRSRGRVAATWNEDHGLLDADVQVGAPYAKPMVAALALSGLANTAAALAHDSTCRATVCYVNNGRDLSAHDFKQLQFHNHPDKGGRLEDSQFFNACKPDLFPQ